MDVQLIEPKEVEIATGLLVYSNGHTSVETLAINLDAVDLLTMLRFMSGELTPKEMITLIRAVCGDDALALCKGSQFIALLKRITNEIGETKNPKETA